MDIIIIILALWMSELIYKFKYKYKIWILWIYFVISNKFIFKYSLIFHCGTP